MAGFDTGGFTPQAQSVLYYHSLPAELITMVFMVLGMLNFSLQYEVWRGKLGELWRNLETRSLALTLLFTLGLVLAGITLAGTFSGFASDLRRGAYQLVNGHSGTGFMTVYGTQMGARWGDQTLFALIVAMGLGGCSCSTSGAVKAIRVGIIGKDLKRRIRKALSPYSAVVLERFHHIRDYTLNEELTSTAFLVTILYLALYLLGTVVGMFYGYGLTASAFESISAAGNVGLTTGVTAWTMPTLLKVVYIFEMWAGRLEVLAILAMFAFLFSAGRRWR
ncbi:MAG: potassium transporter TrkG [Actinomycetota bacterium]